MIILFTTKFANLNFGKRKLSLRRINLKYLSYIFYITGFVCSYLQTVKPLSREPSSFHYIIFSFQHSYHLQKMFNKYLNKGGRGDLVRHLSFIRKWGEWTHCERVASTSQPTNQFPILFTLSPFWPYLRGITI